MIKKNTRPVFTEDQIQFLKKIFRPNKLHVNSTHAEFIRNNTLEHVNDTLDNIYENQFKGAK